MQDLEVGAVLGNVLQGVQQDIVSLRILIQDPVAVNDVLQHMVPNGETQAGDPVSVELWGQNAVSLAESFTPRQFLWHGGSAAGTREPSEGEEDVGVVKDGCRFIVDLLIDPDHVGLSLVSGARE